MKLTAIQLEELTILVLSQINNIIEGSEETVAEVANAIKIYLGCTFDEAVQLMSSLVDAVLTVQSKIVGA